MPQPNGPSLLPVFNPVQMIAVDVPAMPCQSMAVSVEAGTQAAVIAGQRSGVKPLMDIKVREVLLCDGRNELW